MIEYRATDYASICSSDQDIYIVDHLDGFDIDLRNPWLDQLSSHRGKVYTQYIFNEQVRRNYPHLDFEFSGHFASIDSLKNYAINHASLNFENFMCTFNGSDGVGRQFLTAALHKRGWFNKDFSSKNFAYSLDRLDGNIMKYCGSQERYYRKFILDEHSEQFYKSIFHFSYKDNDHAHNLQILTDKIQKSFVQLIGETVCVSYHPWISEKWLYPVMTKNLWISYAQPGYYDYILKNYGFRKFSHIFDYKFDLIKNPVERLIEILDMLGKFATLSKLDWADLYDMEQDALEYNYDHYVSGDYLKIVNKIQ